MGTTLGIKLATLNLDFFFIIFLILLKQNKFYLFIGV